MNFLDSKKFLRNISEVPLVHLCHIQKHVGKLQHQDYVALLICKRHL